MPFHCAAGCRGGPGHAPRGRHPAAGGMGCGAAPEPADAGVSGGTPSPLCRRTGN